MRDRTFFFGEIEHEPDGGDRDDAPPATRNTHVRRMALPMQLPECIGIGLEMVAVVSLRTSKVVRLLVLFSDVNKITAEN